MAGTRSAGIAGTRSTGIAGLGGGIGTTDHLVEFDVDTEIVEVFAKAPSPVSCGLSGLTIQLA